jgi:hypothetical protein
MENDYPKRSLLTVTTTARVCAVVVVVVALLWGPISLAQNGEEGGIVTLTAPRESEATTTNESLRVKPEQLGYSIEEVSSPSDVIPNDFVVGPGKTELIINPGESKTTEIVVTNRTGELREFNFEIEDTAGSNNLETPIVLLGSDRGPYTLKDYIKLPKMSIDLENNQRARIPVTITVPADAEAGGRYGSVLVTTVSKDAVKGTPGGTAPASAIISRLATLFFVTVPGDTEVAGELKSVSTVGDKKVFSEGPIGLQILYENTGDLHLSPYGELRIYNFIGEEVGYVELDPWFAMPQSLRAREIEWNRELLVGRYTVTADVNRGYDDIVDTASVTFWVLPWKLVIGCFAVLFGLFFVIRFFARNFEFKRKRD